MASTAQTNFVKDLFAQANTAAQALADAGDADGVAFVTTAVTPLQDTLVAVLAGVDVPSKDASDAITVLKSLVFTIKSRPAFQAKAQAAKAEAQAALPVGIQAMNAERVIVNRHPGKCAFCATQVEASAGFAVKRGSWSVVCKPCADTTPEARAEARATIIREAREAQEAEQAQRVAQQQVVNALGGEVKAFALDLFNRTETAEKAIPEVRVAIPSLTGNNDLDFFRVRWDHRRYNMPFVLRTIGGSGDQRLDVKQAHKVLEALVFVDDAKAAMATYGQELGHCGYCGKSLTDEESRATGIGPVCAGRI